VRWLAPHTEVTIDTRCLDCGQAIQIRMQDERILEIDPPTTVGHMNTAFAQALSGQVSWGMA
jgi:hypothetical protein